MALFRALFWLLLAAAAAAAITFPPLSGRVVDEAGILPQAVKERISKKLENLEKESTDQFVVVTLKSLDGYDIADYGYRLGRHWGIGRKEKNNGVLLIVAPNDRKVRIEVGYGLEGVLTDFQSDRIIRDVIIPRFKDGDYAGGIEAGTDAVISLLQNPGVPAEKSSSSSKKSFDPFDIAFVILFLISSFIPNLPTQGSLLKSGAASGVVFLIMYLLVQSLLPAVIFAVFVFFIAFFGRSSSSGTGGFGSSGGGFGGGGFSGGGGSFGGGGASGSW